MTDQLTTDGPRLMLAPRADDPNPIAKSISIAIRLLLQLQVPRIGGQADAADLTGRGELLTAYAKIVDGPFAAIGKEGAAHSHSVNAGDFETFISDQVHDHALAAQFAEAAEKFLEEQREYAADHQGWAKAERLGVD